MSPLRVGIVGYGLAGATFHAPLIASTLGLEVASVVTSRPERQEQVRSEYPGATVLERAEQLWERAEEHDLAVVAAPNDVHVALATAALDAGLPVVVDKPLAVTAAGARALVERAEQRGLMLTVFHNRRWDSDQLTLRRLIAAGDLGDVVLHESRFERWRPQLSPERVWRESRDAAQGGGLLLDLGTHLVDQALVLFGPATRVYAEIESVRGGADDDVFVTLHHASGVRSHLRTSALAGAPGPRLRVLGTKGAYLVDGLDGQEDALRAGARPGDGAAWGVEDPARYGRLVRGDESEVVSSEPGAWPQFYAGVVAALRDGAPAPVDPRDAVATLDVLEAARRSSESGSVVELGA